MLVRFSDQDEFVTELEADPHAVARRLVRITTSVYPVMGGSLTRVTVVGTAKVLSQTVGADGEGYDLVEYQEYVGDLWGHGGRDDDVRAKAAELVEQLHEKISNAGFRAAAGRYENHETVQRS